MNYALVTGASSGIGFQYARVLAQKGYNLLIVSNEETINNRAEEIKNEFQNINVIPLVRDLGTDTAAKELFDYCQTNNIKVEVLINNAGVYHDCDFVDDSEKFNELILKLHMITPAMLCYHFGKQMVSDGKGYIINMCSVTSTMPIQRMGTYGASKAFLNNFTQSLYIELKDKGVYVTNVSPGAVNTGLYNIDSKIVKLGKAVGFIVEPDYLARRAVKAMFKGKRKVTIPTIWGNILVMFVRLIPTCVLRLIRKMGWF